MESNNKGRNYTGCWILYAMAGGCCWIALVIAKCCGAIRMNWPAVILGIMWVPVLLLGFILGIVGVLALINEARKQIRERKRRRKIAWTLREAMEGLTLNSIGPIYGVKRQPGEKNRSYKRRILKAARTVDTVHIENVTRPKPATGGKLDQVAKCHGLKRRPGETDEQLQNRIKEAALAKSEGGGTHDRV